jgi:hypothetical protein
MKPDAGLVVAMQRMQTGAEIHRINNLLHQYVCACYTDNRKLAKSARDELIAMMRAKESKRAMAGRCA